MASIYEEAPNYANRGPNIIACSVVLLIVPSITVCIRFWSRVVASRAHFWWDDLMLLLTLLFSHLFIIMNIWGVTLGLGKHIWMIPAKNLQPTLMSEHLQTTFYSTTTVFMRLSALMLYARIFRIDGRVRIGLWVLGGLVSAFWMACIVVPWTNCHPIAKTLHPFMRGECASRVSWYIGSGAINTIFDVIIMLVPMPMILRLNLKAKKKASLMLILVLGYT